MTQRTIEGKLFNKKYADPRYWDSRTPLRVDIPPLIQWYQNLNDIKVRRFLSRLDGQILDVGCGSGRFLGYATLGVDFSRGMLQRARLRHRQRSVVRASLTHMPFRNGIFDYSVMVDVLVHVKPEERSMAISEMQRISRESFVLEGDDRTFFHRIYGLIWGLRFRPRRLVPYLALLFAFPFDRLHSLSFSLLLRKANFSSDEQ